MQVSQNLSNIQPSSLGKTLTVVMDEKQHDK